MTGWTLVARSLRFHWRAHLGVLLGGILGTAILVGALAVGDSVRESLRGMALARLGTVSLALNGGSRFFRAELAEDLSAELKAPVAPVILLRGTAASGGGDARAGRVQVVGVTDAFWILGGGPLPGGKTGEEGSVVLSDRLARKLRVRVGDEVLLRVDKPSLLSRDAPLSTVEDPSVALRLPVSRIVADAEFGRFSLEANQVPPFNAFVPLSLLQEKTGMKGRVNTLLAGGRPEAAIKPADATGALWKHWKLADASLELRELPSPRVLELRTDRIFIDPPTGQAAMRAVPGAQGVLTYFVNELRVRDRATPYSIVSGLEGEVIPPGMKDDEILINQWLADDLEAKPGDELKLTYFVAGPMREFIKRSSAFRIRAVVPIAGAAADRNLMPEFPGVADSENCRDWKPGIPVDLKKIRDKDEQYWHAYRGAPKAFLTLHAAQQLWSNRFGNLTAIRYPTGAQPAGTVQARIQAAINPASTGLFFIPVRDQALAAGRQAMDFGQLFLGFSLFLIVAALLLTALLFAFGVEQRAEEVGTLLALGFSSRRVQGLLLLEGGMLALIAAVVGAGAGVLYTQAMIRGLSTVWSGAVASSALQFHAEPGTLAGGAAAGFGVALLAIWLVTRRQARAPARELLSSGAEGEMQLLAPSSSGKAAGLPTAIAAVVGALFLLAGALTSGHDKAEGYFFGAGALLLLGGIAGCRALLFRMERAATVQRLTVGSLGVRNTARRRGRSLTAIGLLACGSFLVIGVGANRHDPNQDARRRSSGTGGFALYGESTLPVYQDLNSEEGREAFGLDAAALQGTALVPFRLREGDEASCLNLNRAQSPRLLGVQPDSLRQRSAFTFESTIEKTKDGWSLLQRREADGAVPAVGDQNTVSWALGRSLGDRISYTDERGNTFQLHIVGVLANSVLQGSLLISEENFLQRFPSGSGYQVFLVDAPPAGAAAVNDTLTRALEDVGMDLAPAPERLAAFNSVENTYLSIFAVLGGLGLLLGSVGLGVVVLRHVLERRGELALLRAVGFRQAALHWLVFSEHSLLLVLGLLVGIVSALVAVLPALLSPGAQVPYLSLVLTLGAVFLSGFLWTWGATALALRGPLLSALRSE
jgi:ABC-type antimicrobial peptide transport system permease subunit